MARQSQQQTPKTLYVQYDEVSDQIKAGRANMGVVVNAKVDGLERQLLIISDNSSQIVDVVQIEPGKTLSLDKPVMVFGQNSPLDSKYYTANGKMHELVSESRDNATLSAFYDMDFGHSRAGATSYERQLICERALSMLDDSLITVGDGKPALIDYLQKVEQEYKQERQYIHEEPGISSSNYDKAAMVERTADAILNNPSNEFEIRTRTIANDTYVNNISQHLERMSEQKVSGYSNELQKALAEHHIDIDTMKLRHLELAQDIVSKYSTELSQDGILDMVGRTDALSYNKVNEVIQKRREELDEYIYTTQDSTGIKERTKYLDALVELSTTHVYQLESAHSSQSQYHLIADTNIYEAMTQHLNGRGSETTFSLDHAVVSYQGKSQREMYEYLCDKSAVIHELASHYETYIDQFNKNADTISVSQRRDAVAAALCEKVQQEGKATIHETSHVHEFLQSDEFIRILQNKESLFATSVNEGLATRTLRPEYSIAYYDKAQFDLSDPAKCLALQNEIEKRLTMENQLNGRHSQELLAVRDFIADHIQYNEALQSATYNHTISVGLNVQQMGYSSETLSTLNRDFATGHNAMELLRSHGIETDFRSMDNARQMHANYDALVYGFETVANEKLQTALKEMPTKTTVHINGEAWERIVQLASEHNLSEVDEKQRATMLAEAITGVETTLSKQEIKIINQQLNDEFIKELSDMSKMQQKLSPFIESLAGDLRHDIQLTRGCDNLYQRNASSGEYTNPQYADSARTLDFATALNHNSHSETPVSNQSVVLSVIQNHEIRNQMIAEIQAQIDDRDAKREMASRVMQAYDELRKPLLAEEESYTDRRAKFEESLRVATDEKVKTSIEESLKTLENDHAARMATLQQEMQSAMPSKIADAFGISMTENADVKRAILSSGDFISEFNRIAECAKDEKINFVSNQYILSLEQTGGLDALRTIARAEDIKNLDYTRLADSSYLDYLQSQSISSITRQAITDFKQANEAYVEMLIVTRNVEELVHRTQLSTVEYDRLIATADQIAYRNAVEHDPSTSKITYRKFEEMLERAEKAPSEYTQEKIDLAIKNISREATDLQKGIELLYPEENVKIKSSIALSDNIASPTSIERTKGVISSDEELYRLRTQLEETIKSSSHYADYISLNNNTELRTRINEIESQIQSKQDLIKISEDIMAEHQSMAHGWGRFKYEKLLQGDQENIDFHKLQISNLQEERTLLYEQLSGTTTNVPDNIKETVEEYRKAIENQKEQPVVAENASYKLAREIVQLYGDEKPGSKIEEYNAIKLSESLRTIEVPYAMREDLNQVRMEMIEAAKQVYVDRANAMVQEHIDQVIHKINPNSKGIDLSPQNVDEMIKSATTEAEKTRLAGLRDELSTLKGMKFTVDNLDEKILGLVEIDGRAKQIVGQVAHLEELRVEAQGKVDSLEQFKVAVQAYESLEKIREETSMLSHDARAHAAETTFETQQVARYSEIAAILEKSETLASTGSNFADAFKQIHDLADGKGYRNPNALLAELDKPADSSKPITHVSIPNLDAINNYNVALSQIDEPTRVKIATEIAASMGDEKTAPAVYDYVFKPIEAERLKEYTDILTSTRAMIDDIAKMEGADRREIIVQGLHSDNPELTTKAIIAMSHEGALQNIDVPVKEQGEFYEEHTKALREKVGIAEPLIIHECEARSPQGLKINEIESELDKSHQDNIME